MKHSAAYTVLYAALLGLICAGLLAGADHFTKNRRQVNERADEVRTILEVLGVPAEKTASAQVLIELFEHNVEKGQRNGEECYRYLDRQSNDVLAIAFPLEGPGLWGPIRGYLALDGHLRAIRAVVFHDHEETPGLGGEISAKWFTDQFRGLSIYRDEVSPRSIVIGGQPSDAWGEAKVDAITGATMTSQRVEQILNDKIYWIVSGRYPGATHAPE